MRRSVHQLSSEVREAWPTAMGSGDGAQAADAEGALSYDDTEAS